MVDGTCSIEGCAGAVRARGWCGTHYARWRKTGTTDSRPVVRRYCTIEGCQRLVKAQDLCSLHYGRMWTRGSTDDPQRHPGRLERNCETCGAEFLVKKRSSTQRFCGRPCFSKSRVGVPNTWSHEAAAARRGKKLSPEHIQKLKDNHRGMSGRRHSPETKAKLRKIMLVRVESGVHVVPQHKGQKPFLGKTHTPEVRARISAAKMGKANPAFGKTEERSSRWKGDAVGYAGVHDWMTAQYGQPKHCEDCGTTNPRRRYEWANISGEYRRDRADFKRLCKRCHNIFDGVNAYQVGAPPRKNRPARAVKGKPVSSRYKGVTASGYGGWLARLRVEGKTMHLGTFKTEEAAARAYNGAVRTAHGEDAYLNDVSDEPCA